MPPSNELLNEVASNVRKLVIINKIRQGFHSIDKILKPEDHLAIERMIFRYVATLELRM